MTAIDRRDMARVLIATAGIHALLGVIYAGMIFIDPTRLLGISAWIKPLKFAVTGAIYLGTLAILARHLPDSLTEKLGLRRACIISVMILGETLLIGMQSARGVISHFNERTAFDGIIFAVMGVMIIINTVSFVLVMKHFFRGVQKIGGAYLAGIRWGAVLFILGSVVGGVMSGLKRHTIGLPDGGPGLPLVNFSSVAGDLRIAHFLGLHALQILPFIGWFLSRSTKNFPQRQTLVVVFSIFYGVGMSLAFVQALLGLPLLRV